MYIDSIESLESSLTLEKLFKGLADATRLRIVNLLLQSELCVCDMQFVLGAPQPNISRHLIYLKNSGLVLDRREGTRTYYRLRARDAAASGQLFALLQALFAQGRDFAQDSARLCDAITTGVCSVSDRRPFALTPIEG